MTALFCSYSAASLRSSTSVTPPSEESMAAWHHPCLRLLEQCPRGLGHQTALPVLSQLERSKGQWRSSQSREDHWLSY